MKNLLCKLLSVVMLTAVCFLDVSAQEKKSVTGTVRDAADNPVVAATVQEKGTTNQTTTDAKGVFKISINPGATLVISSIGYDNLEVVTDNTGVVTVVMQSSSKELTGVVVTALGIRREKKSLGYSVETLAGSALADAHETNLANALSGKVAGLQVVKSSVGAGGSSKLVLRGYNSLQGSNQPLIVVDGVPMENFTGSDENGLWSAGLDYGNGLADINPEDIANISILKGQSAAALYGARGGNGVIMITTKSGRRQTGLGITFTMTQSVEDIFTKPEFQNSFGQGSNGIFQADVNTSWGPKIEGQSVTKWDGSSVPIAAYDNISAFTRKGTGQNYGLALQQQFGGTAVYASVSYTKDQSIIPSNKLTRMNLSSRVTSKFGPGDKWTSDVKLAYNNTQGFNRPIVGKDQSSLYAIYQLPRSMDITDFAAATNQFGQMLWYPGALAWTPNPYWTAKYVQNQDIRDRFLLNGSLKYNFTDWLDAEVKAGADIYGTNRENKTWDGGPLANSYYTEKQSFIETNYSAMINARKNNLFGKFGGALMIGGNLMNHQWSSLSVNTGSLEVPNLFSPTNAQGTPSVGAGFDHKKINSIFGSLELNYDQWVFLTLTNRNDWTSSLIKQNRSYSYPSASLSWIVTEMLNSFGKSLPSWLDIVKIRASYASVGNDMGAYRLYNGFLIGKDPLGNTVANKETILKNPNVKNELLKSTELGAEIRVLNNRLGLDFTWYKSNATNQLIDLPMDPMSGYSRRIINAGDIQNKGFELILDGRILNNPQSLNWSVRFNYSRNENMIIDIAKDSGVVQYTLGGYDNLIINAVNGQLYGDIYGTKYRRVEDVNSPNYGELLLDNLGLPQATGETHFLGNQQSKGLWGVSNTLSYKGLELFFLIDGRIGGEIFSASLNGMNANGTSAVTAPGGERNKFIVDGVISNGSGGFLKNTVEVTPQDYWARVGTSGNVGIGEANIYDATNVRLRNVMLSYNLPKTVFGKVFQRAKVSVSCNNVWMISSHMHGLDPESIFATGSNAIGFESGAFPTMRTFQFSLNLGF